MASFRDRLLDFKSCWIVFIHVVRGRPGGLSSFAKGELLRSSWHPAQWRWVAKILAASCFVSHSRSVADQGAMPCLDNSRKVFLLGCPSHLIIPQNDVTAFADTTDRNFESISLEYVSLGTKLGGNA